VTKSSIQNQDKIDQSATAFVEKIRSLLPLYSPNAVFNADQSGFQIELRSGRTLSVKGEAEINCLVKGSSSLTHSYTIMPIMSMNRLLSPLYVLLKEAGGKFPAKGHYSFPNLHVCAGFSSIMTKSHLSSWIKHVLCPNLENANTLLLVDSWSTYKDKENIMSNIPEGKEVRIEQIPPGTTGKIQPFDSQYFRTYKSFVRKICDRIMLDYDEYPLNKRDNILKLQVKKKRKKIDIIFVYFQSVCHNQFTADRFQGFIKYSWYRTGYQLGPPEKYVTPLEYCFNELADTCFLCNQCGFLKCAFCEQTLCIDHFFGITDYELFHSCYIQLIQHDVMDI
jgi:hypothetical protein